MKLLRKIKDYFSSSQETCPSELPGRNDACWCGSGKKYKKCHLPEDESRQSRASSIACGSS